MAGMSRFAILLPLILAIVSLVLTSLALFAGHKQGFMEDYAVARLNVSMIGHNVFTNNSTSQDSNDNDDSLLDDIRDKWHDIKGDIEGELNKIIADVADGIANQVGLSDWYSFHILNSCQGNFAPNATAAHTSLNVTNCTTSSPSHRVNLTKLLDHELEVGPLEISLADINWPDSIQHAVNDLNRSLLGFFILYAIGMACCGLAVIVAVCALFAPKNLVLVVLNIVVALIGMLALTIGSIIVIVAGTKGVDKINDVGEDVSVNVQRGTKFYIISWVAAALMICVTAYWISHLIALRRRVRWQRREKSSY